MPGLAPHGLGLFIRFTRVFYHVEVYNHYMFSDQELATIFDPFPASKLHDTFLLVRVLLRFRDKEWHDHKILKEVPGNELVAAGLSIAQIEGAVTVLRVVQKSAEEKMNIEAVGISAVHYGRPTLSEDGNLSGLFGFPFNEVDEALSRREHEFPYRSDKIDVRITKAGRVYVNDRKCELTSKEFEYVLFMRAPLPLGAKTRSLQTIGTAVKASVPNVSRDISTINEKIRGDLGVSFDFIDHSDSAGFFLNVERCNILFD